MPVNPGIIVGIACALPFVAGWLCITWEKRKNGSKEGR